MIIHSGFNEAINELIRACDSIKLKKTQTHSKTRKLSPIFNHPTFYSEYSFFKSIYNNRGGSNQSKGGIRISLSASLFESRPHETDLAKQDLGYSENFVFQHPNCLYTINLQYSMQSSSFGAQCNRVSKITSNIVDVRWFVSNHTIHTHLHIPTVTVTISFGSLNFQSNLPPNTL